LKRFNTYPGTQLKRVLVRIFIPIILFIVGVWFYKYSTLSIIIRVNQQVLKRKINKQEKGNYKNKKCNYIFENCNYIF